MGNKALGVSFTVDAVTATGAANASSTYTAPSVTIETLTENSTQSTPDTTIGACGAAITSLDVTGSGSCPTESAINAFAVIVDDNFANLADQQSKTRVDNAATLVELDDLNDDVVLVAAQMDKNVVDIAAIITALKEHGLMEA